ncbi:NAD(+) diphosphatase [Motiliproteus coralliicola]|uniref:NAD(+) diphosphatase n=1 Tax=Motiliproteus coralliicola TaxID=2283196 RepID=A0A369WSS6_9GAMM|nr:NAD(+) diphosphatase [Motiliproteus coralliicola]RDE24129.1 NAD(+) diphosphatase [Motiliproteus coralliicola]
MYWLGFVGDRLLVDGQRSPLLRQPPEQWEPMIELQVGEHRGRSVQLLCFDAKELPTGWDDAGLRSLMLEAEPELAPILGRAAQLNSWYRNHRFCSRCGEPTRADLGDFSACCDRCGYHQYPRISPCIIVLVTRPGEHGEPEQCLLAHAAHFQTERYSTLAGFIEAGETAEQAVAREVMEEVGIEVKNIRYWQSQSWPFPHSLMLGFYAEYAGGEIQPDGVEIVKAAWFDAQSMPELPPKLAISTTLIEGFLAGVHHQL